MTDEVQQLRMQLADHGEHITRLEADNERLQGIEQFVTEAARHERDGLRAEIERLRTQCSGNCRYWEGRWRDEAKDNDRLRGYVETLKTSQSSAVVNELNAEIERLSADRDEWIEHLEAEIDRLRSALQEIVDSIAAVGPAAPMLERARRALEPKP